MKRTNDCMDLIETFDERINKKYQIFNGLFVKHSTNHYIHENNIDSTCVITMDESNIDHNPFKDIIVNFDVVDSNNKFMQIENILFGNLDKDKHIFDEIMKDLNSNDDNDYLENDINIPYSKGDFIFNEKNDETYDKYDSLNDLHQFYELEQIDCDKESTNDSIEESTSDTQNKNSSYESIQFEENKIVQTPNSFNYDDNYDQYVIIDEDDSLSKNIFNEEYDITLYDNLQDVFEIKKDCNSKKRNYLSKRGVTELHIIELMHKIFKYKHMKDSLIQKTVINTIPHTIKNFICLVINGSIPNYTNIYDIDGNYVSVKKIDSVYYLHNLNLSKHYTRHHIKYKFRKLILWIMTTFWTNFTYIQNINTNNIYLDEDDGCLKICNFLNTLKKTTNEIEKHKYNIYYNIICNIMEILHIFFVQYYNVAEYEIKMSQCRYIINLFKEYNMQLKTEQNISKSFYNLHKTHFKYCDILLNKILKKEFDLDVRIYYTAFKSNLAHHLKD